MYSYSIVWIIFLDSIDIFWGIFILEHLNIYISFIHHLHPTILPYFLYLLYLSFLLSSPTVAIKRINISNFYAFSVLYRLNPTNSIFLSYDSISLSYHLYLSILPSLSQSYHLFLSTLQSLSL